MINIRKYFLDKVHKKIDLFIIVILIASFICGIFWIFTPIPKVLHFVPDDTFFYFKIAKNIVNGVGVTFDGINPTNGFQPLWQVLLVPIFYFFKQNLILPLRITWGIGIIINAIIAILLYKFCISRDLSRSTGLVTAFIWLFFPFISMATVSGLESGLYALFLMTILYYYPFDTPFHELKFRRKLILGALLGFTFLARLDAIFLIAIVALFIFVQKNISVHRKIRDTITILVPTALISFPYIIWNYINFDMFTPISGKVKHSWTMNHIAEVSTLSSPTEIFKRVLGSVLHITDPRFSLFISVLFFAIIILYLYKKCWISKIKFFLLFCLLLFIFYNTYFFEQVSGWHFTPLYILFAIVLGIVYEEYFLKLLEKVGIAKESNKAAIGLAVAFTISLIFFSATYYYSQMDSSKNKYMLPHATWLKENTEKDAIIGCGNPGVIGYFSERKVIETGGLVNSPQFYRATQEGTVAEYLAKLNTSYLTDYSLGEGGFEPNEILFNKYPPEKLSLIYKNKSEYDSGFLGDKVTIRWAVFRYDNTNQNHEEEENIE